MKLTTIIKNIHKVEKRIDELYSYQDYPYKQGHMICVNRKLDEWQPSNRNKNMIRTQTQKLNALDNKLNALITDLIENKNYGYKECLQLLVENGYYIDRADDTLIDLGIE